MSDGIGCICAARYAGECACDADWTPAEVVTLRAALGNLLAVIHRDGGQYLAAHGIEKACADAEAEVAKWIMLESSIDELIEQSARAEREACAIIAISPICGSQGFAGPSCCILAPGHKGGHKYGIPRDRTAGEIAAAIRARSEHLPEMR